MICSVPSVQIRRSDRDSRVTLEGGCSLLTGFQRVGLEYPVSLDEDVSVWFSGVRLGPKRIHPGAVTAHHNSLLWTWRHCVLDDNEGGV